MRLVKMESNWGMLDSSKQTTLNWWTADKSNFLKIYRIEIYKQVSFRLKPYTVLPSSNMWEQQPLLSFSLISCSREWTCKTPVRKSWIGERNETVRWKRKWKNYPHLKVEIIPFSILQCYNSNSKRVAKPILVPFSDPTKAEGRKKKKKKTTTTLVLSPAW